MSTNYDVPRQRLLTIVCLLLSAHFAIAYSTLTTQMVSFHSYKNMTGEGGPFAYRMLPALLWKLLSFILRPVHHHLPLLHMPHLNPPFTSDEDWFVVLLTFASILGTLFMARRLLRRSMDTGVLNGWLLAPSGLPAHSSYAQAESHSGPTGCRSSCGSANQPSFPVPGSLRAVDICRSMSR